jgi:hypothetical protein
VSLRCLRALVAEYSAATCWDGAPSAPLSVMPTQHKFWRNDRTMDASQLSRFGLTCAVLTEDRGAALLTWFRADSRVRTYPLLGMAPVSMANVLASGAKWLESSARYDLDSSSWRTHRCLWDEALPWSSVTLPSWGMTRSGFVFQHPTAERPISGTASGLLPTPRASMGPHGVAWSRAQAGEHRHNLEDFLAMQWLQAGNPVVPGLNPNPEFIEWMMGFPIGWTGLKPLEMRRFHEWQRQHSPLSLISKEAA